MGRTPRALVALCAAALLVSCGDDPDVTAPAGGEPAVEADAESISFGAALAQIRGHHLVALELYQAGDEKGAAVHAGHPIAEIYDSVASELSESGEDPEQLLLALEAGAAAIADVKPPSDVSTAFDEAARVTDEVLAGALGSGAADAGYQGSVISALLDTAAHEYEEAVGPHGIRLEVEYQDGYGFVREAARLYEEIVADVEAASAEEAEEIEEAFDALAQAFPSVEPPKDLVDALDVESAAELIGHELEETVGAQPLEESDPAEVVAEIEELLGEIEDEYAAGDAEAAAELSAEAYLENYEVIEADVIELAPDVNDELEPLLGAELRRQIQAGASQQEIESMIDRARELLREALDALEAEH